jgi:hypothetical protein
MEVVELNESVGEGLSLLVESCYSCGRGLFGNPEKGERPPLEAVTRRLMKTHQAEKT